MKSSYDAIVLMGPLGSGKSFLGNRLDRQGVASYCEMEPILRERFGSGGDFESHLEEAGAFLWRSYRDQLSESELAVAFESAGIADRALLESLQRRYRVALVLVQTDRSVCIDRVVQRPPEKNISHTLDRGRLGRHYDLWQQKVLPSYRFALSVDGNDVESAVASSESFLARDSAAPGGCWSAE